RWSSHPTINHIPLLASSQHLMSSVITSGRRLRGCNPVCESSSHDPVATVAPTLGTGQPSPNRLQLTTLAGLVQEVLMVGLVGDQIDQVEFRLDPLHCRITDHPTVQLVGQAVLPCDTPEHQRGVLHRTVLQ